ncbi:MAG: hypothetical protein K0S55_1400, partial [Clostridia bacterium]|nr:hypothetical protein [Clostridia bacterium]
MFLSILTPTFNRAYILRQCYESLVRQTNKDFEWIVIDDGSTDNTENLVNEFIREEKITIQYIKQENGGKHRAHNAGVCAAQGTLTVCLDSDDALTENMVQRAEEVWGNRGQGRFAGILALRGDFERRKPICSTIPGKLTSSTMFELFHKHGFSGDTILLFDTGILKQNYFAEFPEENFIPEGSLYAVIDEIAPMILVNEVWYLCKYLEDGLTAKYHKLLIENPAGTAYTYYKMLMLSDTIKLKLKYAILTNAYKKLTNRKLKLDFSKKKLLLILTYLPSIVYRKRVVNRDNKLYLADGEKKITTKMDLKDYMRCDKYAMGITRKFPRIFDSVWLFLIVLRKHEYYENRLHQPSPSKILYVFHLLYKLLHLHYG